DRVVHYGQQGKTTPSVYEALDPETIRAINKQLSAQANSQSLSTAVSYLDMIHPMSSDFLELHTRGVRPWMAFFTIWSAFLNWKHSMDVEAFHLARQLGKKIEYLETLEDQLEALDGIPFDRIVNYLNQFSHWKVHKELYLKAFLEGDLPKFFSMTGEFPTRCESILKKRDPIFFEKMKTFFPKGRTVAFVGVAHIPGIRKMFLDEGYQATQEER
ncbi:MAG: TraB/GumN family protein, partial [Deltaproteobacteria bacterium]|nr:TraB/GumN family protein [Deltaproteobacteria bacterium]